MSSLESWRGLLAPYGAPLAAIDAAHVELCARYAEPHRHYHDLRHIEAVLSRLPDKPALRLAAWLHDAVYDTHRNDNEERSADLARVMLPTLNVPAAIIDEAARLILLTKTHEADDADGQALLDADLAILAAPEAEYEAYAAAIRREYDWVPEAEYRAGRARVLERFLARDLAEAARCNLERECRLLRSGG